MMSTNAISEATSEPGSTSPHMPMPREAAVYIAGHRGLVGSALWRHLGAQGFTNLLGRTSQELDLRNHSEVEAFFNSSRPDYVILAAAKVGGILANSTHPAEFLSDNLRIQVNVLDAAARFGVKRLLFLGSSCIYPKLAQQPIKEESLLTGSLEETNASYAIAKISGVLHVQALRQEFGLPYISAMPTNLYGPNDNFDIANSHVLPAILRKMHDAKRRGDPSVLLWGTGSPRREFLHVDDLASACLALLERYDAPEPINVGVGTDLTIKELAVLVAKIVGFSGEVIWDASKPDGTPQKLLDVSRINDLGWRARIPLADGIETTYKWFREQASLAVE